MQILNYNRGMPVLVITAYLCVLYSSCPHLKRGLSIQCPYLDMSKCSHLPPEPAYAPVCMMTLNTSNCRRVVNLWMVRMSSTSARVRGPLDFRPHEACGRTFRSI